MIVSVQTIKGTFKKWEVGRRFRTDVAEAVKSKIQYYFLEELADDITVLQNLQRYGYFLVKWTLVRLRFELGPRRRIQSVGVQAKADALIHEATQKQVKKEMKIEKETTLNKTQKSAYQRKSSKSFCKARKSGISETTNPRQERSPRTRHLQEHAWRDDYNAFTSNAEAKKDNGSQSYDDAASIQSLLPTPVPSAQVTGPILPAWNRLRGR